MARSGREVDAGRRRPHDAALTEPTSVYLEVGAKRAFASAADWPGWCRGGRNEQAALEALEAYTARYASVLRLAKLDPPPAVTGFQVVERLSGSASTDFGVPGMPASHESRALGGREAARMCDLVRACWDYLDRVRAKAPAALRKGPRGGGRDRDAMFDHVLGAEMEYAKRISLRLKAPDGQDSPGIQEFRRAIIEAMARPTGEERWPMRYAARRTAWHALDHAWEMEDRSK